MCGHANLGAYEAARRTPQNGRGNLFLSSGRAAGRVLMCALRPTPTTKGLCCLILERTDEQFRIAAAVSQRMNTPRRRYRRRSSRTLRGVGRTDRTCFPWGNRPNTGPGPEAIPPVRPPLYSIHGASQQLLLCVSAPPVRVQFALPEAPLVFPRVPVQGPSGGSQGQTRSACSQFVG